MTVHDRPGDEHEAVRLFRALTHEDPLTTAEAETWIAALVQAEADGVDVDDDPAWAAVLHHLEHCAECLALYEAVADDLQAVTAAQLGHGPSAPSSQSANPLTVWHTSSISLEPRQGDKPRNFILMLIRPPQHAYAHIRENSSSYGIIGEPTGKHATITVSGGTGDYTDVRVEVAEAAAGQPWMVQLSAPTFVLEEQTDAQGIAIFRDIPLGRADEITITGREADSTD